MLNDCVNQWMYNDLHLLRFVSMQKETATLAGCPYQPQAARLRMSDRQWGSLLPRFHDNDLLSGVQFVRRHHHEMIATTSTTTMVMMVFRGRSCRFTFTYIFDLPFGMKVVRKADIRIGWCRSGLLWNYCCNCKIIKSKLTETILLHSLVLSRVVLHLFCIVLSRVVLHLFCLVLYRFGSGSHRPSNRPSILSSFCLYLFLYYIVLSWRCLSIVVFILSCITLFVFSRLVLYSVHKSSSAMRVDRNMNHL